MSILVNSTTLHRFPATFESVGRPKHTKIMAGAIEGNNFVGAKAEQLRGLLTLNYPMTHGIVTDWPDMEYIWNHTFAELKAQAEEVSKSF